MNERGCGFLADVEVDAWLERRLDPAREEAFEQHIMAGCGPCALLAEDARVFAEAGSVGLSRAEREDFETRREFLERKLAAKAAGDGSGQVSPRWRRRRLAWLGIASAAAVVFIALLVPGWRGGGLGVPLPDGTRFPLDAMPFTAPPAIRAEGADAGAWQLAGAAYGRQDWDDAAARFALLRQADPASVDAALYEGIAHLMAGHAQKAITALDEARARAAESGRFSGAATWYRALAALQQGDTARAREALDEAALSDGVFAVRARELRGRL